MVGHPAERRQGQPSGKDVQRASRFRRGIKVGVPGDPSWSPGRRPWRADWSRRSPLWRTKREARGPGRTARATGRTARATGRTAGETGRTAGETGRTAGETGRTAAGSDGGASFDRRGVSGTEQNASPRDQMRPATRACRVAWSPQGPGCSEMQPASTATGPCRRVGAHRGRLAVGFVRFYVGRWIVGGSGSDFAAHFWRPEGRSPMMGCPTVNGERPPCDGAGTIGRDGAHATNDGIFPSGRFRRPDDLSTSPPGVLGVDGRLQPGVRPLPTVGGFPRPDEE